MPDEATRTTIESRKPSMMGVPVVVLSEKRYARIVQEEGGSHIIDKATREHAVRINVK